MRNPLDLHKVTSSRPNLVALGALLIYTSIGGVYFKLSMGITWIQGFYLAISTVTTVGYGDLSPRTAHEDSNTRLVLGLLYILLGLVVVGGCLGLLVAQVVERPLLGSSDRSFLAWRLLMLVAAVCVGALAISLLEGWGAMLGFYWAVVTLSTVGYGDAVPTSDGARLFAIFFIFFGVSLVGKIVSDLAAFPLAVHRRRLQEKVLRQYGDELVAEELWELAAGDEMRRLHLSQSSAFVTREEFCLAMLIRQEKISEDDLGKCQEAFSKLDILETGRLDTRDLRAWNSRRSEIARTMSSSTPPLCGTPPSTPSVPSSPRVRGGGILGAA